VHFLKKAASKSHTIGRPRAAVKVMFDAKKKALVLVEGEGIMVLKWDALIAEIPSDVPILDAKGKRIPASGAFFVTTETFDPYHAVVDLPLS
jgi:hypothetical protein